MRYQLGIPKIYRTEALVLKRMNLGEADRIVTLYTPGYGKIRAVAKGIRRPGSKLGGHLELLTRSNLMMARGQNLDIITQSQAIDNFLPLKEDLWRTGLAFYVLELIDRFTEEGIENYTVYKLLVDTLGWLTSAKDGELVLRFFELRLLALMGYMPRLDKCVKCGEVRETGTTFSYGAGGVICHQCGLNEIRGTEISIPGIKALRFLQENPYTVAGRLKLNENLRIELTQLLKGYIRYILERDLKSVEFLETIREKTGSA